jgi:hypothetical protein
MLSMNSLSIEKEIKSALKKYDCMYKPEIIRINISSTFLSRARCKNCGKNPSFYYYVRKPFLWKDISEQISTSKLFREWIERMSADWYLDSAPKYFHDIKEFSFSLDDKHYVPTLHRMRGVDSTNIVELVVCECGASTWAFADKSNRKRPEITNRKGRYKYPQRFKY